MDSWLNYYMDDKHIIIILWMVTQPLASESHPYYHFNAVLWPYIRAHFCSYSSICLFVCLSLSAFYFFSEKWGQITCSWRSSALFWCWIANLWLSSYILPGRPVLQGLQKKSIQQNVTSIPTDLQIGSQETSWHIFSQHLRAVPNRSQNNLKEKCYFLHTAFALFEACLIWSQRHDKQLMYSSPERQGTTFYASKRLQLWSWEDHELYQLLLPSIVDFSSPLHCTEYDMPF